jgi:hypothetical protein
MAGNSQPRWKYTNKTGRKRGVTLVHSGKCWITEMKLWKAGGVHCQKRLGRLVSTMQYKSHKTRNARGKEKSSASWKSLSEEKCLNDLQHSKTRHCCYPLTSFNFKISHCLTSGGDSRCEDCRQPPGRAGVRVVSLQ